MAAGANVFGENKVQELCDNCLLYTSLDEIGKLEITPAQLALEPCSAGCVITDPNTGEVLACVSYPGYDNNRLTNTMDSAYFASLNLDHSSPLYSKATQQQTAPGSTFKPVTAVAGLEEGVISPSEICLL